MPKFVYDIPTLLIGKTKSPIRAVIVAQLTEPLFSIPENLGLDTVPNNVLFDWH